ncbi:MAG TPA: hypothetical protein VFI62_10550 [Burkholderiales bacterium]|nr:hypothetical protein [Burkholderiales bacterium]
MLRLWRDRLLVSIAPDTVSWLRVTGRMKPRVSSKRSVQADPDHGPELWSGAVATLAHEAESWRREALDVTIVLSNHFVRYTVVPQPKRVNNSDEALALARFHFTKIHGERAAGWDVRLSPASGGATLASAIDNALLATLKACFSSAGKPRLTSIQPYTMAAFNTWRGRVDAQGAWLLLVEPGIACLALLAGKNWTAIQNIKGHLAAADDCTALLAREKYRIGVEPMPSTVLTHVPGRAPSALAARRDWRFVILDLPAVPGVSMQERDAYAMVLHAV